MRTSVLNVVGINCQALYSFWNVLLVRLLLKVWVCCACVSCVCAHACFCAQDAWTWWPARGSSGLWRRGPSWPAPSSSSPSPRSSSAWSFPTPTSTAAPETSSRWTHAHTLVYTTASPSHTHTHRDTLNCRPSLNPYCTTQPSKSAFGMCV